jgi:hypothetical protein
MTQTSSWFLPAASNEGIYIMCGAKDTILRSATIVPVDGDEINDPNMLEAATAARRSQTNNPGERLIEFQFRSVIDAQFYNLAAQNGSIRILDNAERTDATGIYIGPISGIRYGYAAPRTSQVPVEMCSETLVAAPKPPRMDTDSEGSVLAPAEAVVPWNATDYINKSRPPPAYVSYTSCCRPRSHRLL